MTNTNTIEDEESDLIEKSESMKRYLIRYEEKLFHLMTSLEEEDDLEDRSKALETVVMRFEKVALKFLELRYKLEAYRTKNDPSAVLDTKAARKEIFARIDRIRKSEEVSEAS